MSDGETVVCHVWIPESEATAAILISHGMGEYAGRYERFARAATERGYAVFAPDHRGHGETAGSPDRFGYLADGDGFSRVRDDLAEIADRIETRFPGMALMLLGHSFGSLVAQHFIETYGARLRACVLSGTRGPNRAESFFGHLAAVAVSRAVGRRTPSPLLDRLAFGANNSRFPDRKSEGAWLSRDEEEVRKYEESPLTGFVCAAGFYEDLTAGLMKIHAPAALARIPRDLPVLLASGSDDPVGGYGKTVSDLARRYRAMGMEDVTLSLYPGARHEILNETNRDEVTADILGWLDARR